MSDLLTGKLKTAPDLSNNHSARSVLNETRKFTAKFLRKNWRWAYEQLKDELSRIDEEKLLAEKEKPVRPTDQNGFSSETTTVNSDIKNATVELQAGNLTGWKLLYSINRSTDLQHSLEIAGETLEEKEDALQAFLVKNKISSSVKPSSIIDTFDWLVTVPKEVEQIRMSKTVNGETFKKIKRGRVRILYVMDEAKKQIIFFLHQKKAWEYGF